MDLFKDTLQSFIAIATQGPPTVISRGSGRSENMSYPTRHCHCDEFRPYRTLGEDELDFLISHDDDVYYVIPLAILYILYVQHCHGVLWFS